MYYFPLSAEMISGTSVILARNVQPSIRMEPVASLHFSIDGVYEGDMYGRWSIQDGELVMTDNWNKPVFVFRGTEIRNGSVFLTGEPMMEAQVSGFVRSTIYPRKSLHSDFRICISSHVDYAGETIPRLLRSLTRIGFPKDRVIVVVGGSAEAPCMIDGYQQYGTVQNFDGLTALSYLASNPMDYDGYWLLLHDTMEVADDFSNRMAGIDIGLNFDMILRYTEVGLYSSSFIRLLGQTKVFDAKTQVKVDILTKMARLWCDFSGNGSNHAQTKDVYGTGTQRDVLYLSDFGIKKFRRIKSTGAKP